MRSRNSVKISWLEIYRESARAVKRLEMFISYLNEEYEYNYHVLKRMILSNEKEIRQTLQPTLIEIEEAKQEKEKHEQRMRKVADKIEAVEDDFSRQLLTLRYINLMKWSEIADRMVYSCEYLKGYGLNKALECIQIEE